MTRNSSTTNPSTNVPSPAAGKEPASSVAFRPTVAELQTKLADRQARIDSQDQEIQRLRAEVASLRMRIARRPGANTAGLNAEQELVKKLVKLGKYFAVFYRFVITPDKFGQTRPTFTFTDPVRYSSPAYEKLGFVSELFDCVPAAMHALIMETVSDAIDPFSKGMQDSRSQSVYKVSKVAAIIFSTSVDPSAFSTNANNHPRSDFPGIQKLLGLRKVFTAFTGKQSIQFIHSDYACFPPVLYKDFDPSDARKLFLSTELIVMAKIILGIENSMRVTSTYRHIDDRQNRTTPGLIAWTATVAIYTLSDDTSFSATGKGSITQCPYLENFDIYVRYLIQHRLSLNHLFGFWDCEVFSSNGPPPGNGPTGTCTVATTAPATPLSQQPTVPAYDPLANIIANFRQHSNISTDEDSEEEAEEFPPPELPDYAPRSPIENDDNDNSDNANDNNGNNTSSPASTLQPHALRTSPSASEAPGPFGQSVQAPVTSSSSESVDAADPPAATSGNRKRAATRGRALQADATIVPARQTRSRRSRGD